MDHTTLAPRETTEKAGEALHANHFLPEVIASGADALARIKELIPEGASVMNGASKSLEKIGFIDYLKAGQHGWNNLHDRVLEETDEQKKAHLRRAGVISDFYLGSVHAVTEDGQMVIASNSGSQLPHLAFTSPNLILVVSTKKIVPDLTSAFERIKTHIIPLEDERMKQVYGYGTNHAKTLILHNELPAMGRKVHVLLVEEDFGF